MFLHKAHLPTSYNLLLFQKTHLPLNSNKNYLYTIQFPLYYQNIFSHKSNPISYNHKPLSMSKEDKLYFYKKEPDILHHYNCYLVY